MGGLVGSIAVARLFAFQRENLVMDILTVAASFISSCTLSCQLLPLQLDELCRWSKALRRGRDAHQYDVKRVSLVLLPGEEGMVSCLPILGKS